MRYVSLAIVFCLLGCKASVESDSDIPSSTSPSIAAIVHCSKLIRVTGEYLDEVTEGDSKSKTKKAISSDEHLLDISYTLREDSNGNKEIECTIEDESKTYQSSNYVPFHAIGKRNECSIMYDLDKSSGGSFSIEYDSNGGWIDYFDYDNKLQYNFKIRSSECSELAL